MVWQSEAYAGAKSLQRFLFAPDVKHLLRKKGLELDKNPKRHVHRFLIFYSSLGDGGADECEKNELLEERTYIRYIRHLG